jgi:hypothetical protein
VISLSLVLLQPANNIQHITAGLWNVVAGEIAETANSAFNCIEATFRIFGSKILFHLKSLFLSDIQEMASFLKKCNPKNQIVLNVFLCYNSRLLDIGYP